MIDLEFVKAYWYRAYIIYNFIHAELGCSAFLAAQFIWDEICTFACSFICLQQHICLRPSSQYEYYHSLQSSKLPMIRLRCSGFDLLLVNLLCLKILLTKLPSGAKHIVHEI